MFLFNSNEVTASFVNNSVGSRHIQEQVLEENKADREPLCVIFIVNDIRQRYHLHTVQIKAQEVYPCLRKKF